jgi:LPS sulfotransferase NodH
VTLNRMSAPASTRFVLITHPRCGSTYLATLLNSHPEVLCHGELFYRAEVFYAVGHRDGSLHLASVAERDADPRAFLEKVWGTTFGNRAVGFKLVAGQHPGAFRGVFDDPGARAIVLRRRNRLKKFVSALIAEREQMWTHYKYRFRAEDLKPIQVEVSLERLGAYLAAESAFYDGVLAELARRPAPYAEVFYEDLFAGPQAVEELLRFLEVSLDARGLEPATHKRNSRRLAELIANFDEVARQVAGTDLAPELHDVGY